eukprot:SAG11_NODE_12356_length_707_cov_1.689145_1_plen_98_part_00
MYFLVWSHDPDIKFSTRVRPYSVTHEYWGSMHPHGSIFVPYRPYCSTFSSRGVRAVTEYTQGSQSWPRGPPARGPCYALRCARAVVLLNLVGMRYVL